MTPHKTNLLIACVMRRCMGASCINASSKRVYHLHSTADACIVNAANTHLNVDIGIFFIFLFSFSRPVHLAHLCYFFVFASFSSFIFFFIIVSYSLQAIETIIRYTSKQAHKGIKPSPYYHTRERTTKTHSRTIMGTKT